MRCGSPQGKKKRSFLFLKEIRFYQIYSSLLKECYSFGRLSKKINQDLIIIKMQRDSIQDLFDDDHSGRCLHCVGHSEALCFCQFLVGEQSTSVTSQFISNTTLLPPQEPETFSQPQSKQVKPKRKTVKKAAKKGGKKSKAEKVSSRKLKKDNISHKRISTVVKNIAQRLLGRKLSAGEKSNFHREDYVVRIFTILEREGLLRESYLSYKEQMNKFIRKIESSNGDQPEYCAQLLKQTESYGKAFALFLEGRHELSMRIIYDYENMRQKAKFESAVSDIEKIRTQQGLPFQRE